MPLEPALDLKKLYSYLEKAIASLAELNVIYKTIPNTYLFIYMYVRKEASEVSLSDVEEVSNYVKALNYDEKWLSTVIKAS